MILTVIYRYPQCRVLWPIFHIPSRVLYRTFSDYSIPPDCLRNKTLSASKDLPILSQPSCNTTLACHNATCSSYVTAHCVLDFPLYPHKHTYCSLSFRRVLTEFATHETALVLSFIYRLPRTSWKLYLYLRALLWRCSRSSSTSNQTDG